jgi:hypothetical protein
VDERKRIAVRLRGDDLSINQYELAAQHGYECLGGVGELEHVYVFQELPVDMRR